MKRCRALSTSVARPPSAVLVRPVANRALTSGREPASTSLEASCHRNVQQSQRRGPTATRFRHRSGPSN